MQQGSTLLKVISILMIAFGCITAGAGAVAFFGGTGVALLGADMDKYGTALGLLTAGAGIAIIVTGAVDIIIGAVGLNASKRAGKNTAAFVLGIIGTVVALLDLFIAFSGGDNQQLASALFGLVLPVLYLVGVNQTRSAASRGKHSL